MSGNTVIIEKKKHDKVLDIGNWIVYNIMFSKVYNK